MCSRQAGERVLSMETNVVPGLRITVAQATAWMLPTPAHYRSACWLPSRLQRRMQTPHDECTNPSLVFLVVGPAVIQTYVTSCLPDPHHIRCQRPGSACSPERG
jgi:hypothetical protein